jgi:hypothetical protein
MFTPRQRRSPDGDAGILLTIRVFFSRYTRKPLPVPGVLKGDPASADELGPQTLLKRAGRADTGCGLLAGFRLVQRHDVARDSGLLT